MSVSKHRRNKRLIMRRQGMSSSFEPLESRQLLSCVIDTRVAGGGKSVNVTSVGQVVHLEVWAIITGADATGSNDGFQSVAGSFLSTSSSSGSVLGNMSSAVLSPFTASGAQDGTPVDLDGDGDLDVGSNDSNNFPPYFSARSGGSATTSGGVISGASHAYEIGTITYVVTNLKSGQASSINFRERGDDGFTGGALWTEDNNFTDSNTGSYSVGAPVVISDSAVVPTGQTISGEVYNDSNGNGKLESGETGVSGVVVYIDANNNGVKDGSEATATTDGGGNYSFTGIKAGTYILRQMLPNGAKQTAPSGGTGQHVTVGSANVAGVNFGDTVTTVSTGLSISGEVYKDSNGNGKLDAGETGLASVTLYIDANNNGAKDSTEATATTDANGNYSFTGVKAGTYIVRQTLPSGDKQTAPSGGMGQHVTVGSTNVTGVNFGDTVTTVSTGQTISGEVYNDANSSGSLTSGETGISGVILYSDANNNGVKDSTETTATTDGSGNFTFTNLPAGAYIIRQVVPTNFKQTAPTSNMGQHVTVTSGKNVTGINFGDVSTSTAVPASISGEVFKDTNNNAKLDSGETGLTGVTVFLDVNNNGIMDGSEARMVTTSGGLYTFSNVAAGNYIVRQVLPSGYKQSLPTGGLGAHITVAAGKATSGVNFGDVPTASAAALIAAPSSLFSNSAIGSDSSTLDWATA